MTRPPCFSRFAGTLVDEPTKIGLQINDVSQPMLYVFLLYVLLSTYTVLNMLVGILCEVRGAVRVGSCGFRRFLWRRSFNVLLGYFAVV